jgi:hypothetical protein
MTSSLKGVDCRFLRYFISDFLQLFSIFWVKFEKIIELRDSARANLFIWVLIHAETVSQAARLNLPPYT